MDDDFKALIDETLSTEAQVKTFIEYSIQERDTTKQANEQAVGHPVEWSTFLDGSSGDLSAIQNLSQVVTIVFGIADEVLTFIAEQIEFHSPVSSSDKHPGLYKHSNILLADGVVVEDRTRLPQAKEYIYLNSTPYAEKIERGESAQAPSGVYELTANQAQRQFPSVRIDFIDYNGGQGSSPAIRVII